MSDQLATEPPYGSVVLVGAGPGDPELLTIAGCRHLMTADVVLHDRLVGPQILDRINVGARVINVGKSSDGKGLSQEDINHALLGECRAGNKVVRLKGGDPMVFGRGAEEALFLMKEGIPCEVVPGISSAIAGPSAAGIPVTHRGISSCFSVVTASEDPEKLITSVDWGLLAKGGHTLVILMVLKRIDQVVSLLISEGRDPCTPSALIQSATLPEQSVSTGYLRDISSIAGEYNASSPAMLVVGKVVDIGIQLGPRSFLPLAGKRILVTRSRAQSSRLCELILRLGGSPLELPTIAIQPQDDYTELDSSIEDLPDYDWIVFSSVNAVESFFSRLCVGKRDARYMQSIKIAAIGPSTASALRDRGLVADLVPDKSTSESLVQCFGEVVEGGLDVIVLGPESAPATIRNGLTSLGCKVRQVAAYRTIIPKNTHENVRKLMEKRLDVITFTSSSTVRNFLSIWNGIIPSDVVIACIGPATAATAVEMGISPDIVAEPHNVDGLVDSITGYYSRGDE